MSQRKKITRDIRQHSEAKKRENTIYQNSWCPTKAGHRGKI